MYIRVPINPELSESAVHGSPFGNFGLAATAPSLDTMTCRLLCAANLTYAPAPAAKPPYYLDSIHRYYYTNAGLIDRPKVIEGVGTKKIDSCLIGTLQDSASGQRNVVLAFRGTLPPGAPSLAYFKTMVLDWCNDLEAVPAAFPNVPGVSVHHGFNQSIGSFFGRGIVTAINARLRSNPGAQLYITGHSKGGALAYLAALLLHKRHPEIPLAGVISFEAPRAGQPSFAKAFNDSGIASLRYEFQDDIVPHLPQSETLVKLLTISSGVTQVLSVLYPNRARSFAFEHAGTLRFIDWEGNIGGDSEGLKSARTMRLIQLIGKTGGTAILPLLATQHPAGCGTKTWNILCKAMACP